ncbi:hypothetical protein [Leucobacter luti]|uniref:hypothetical protein n=1 Tax=Leucobacter luti TaxID=340320 RepID=UPI003CFEDE88
MSKHLLSIAALAAAAGLLLSGCAPKSATENTSPMPEPAPEPTTSVLVSENRLPEGFPETATEIRSVVDGEKIAYAWHGEGRTQGCEPSDGFPDGYAAPLLLQDVALKNVVKCGDFWQAEQADGSFLAWNTPHQL